MSVLAPHRRKFFECKEDVVFFSLAVLIPLAFTLYTRNVWEDYFITFRHSRHLAEGYGLVYHIGERVHGFTSPIGVLLPALFHRVLGNPDSFWPALWCFRIVGILAFALGVTMLVQTLRLAAPDARTARWCAGLLLLTDAKTIAFTTNGQETGLVIFFLAWILFLQQQGVARNWHWLALAWAGLQWTRPDGCVAAAGAAFVAIVWPVGERRRDVVGALPRIAAGALLLYLPWIAWAAVYYGTPIPHTVVAKAGYAIPPWEIARLSRILLEGSQGSLDPILHIFDGWPEVVGRPAKSVFLTFYTLMDRVRGRAGMVLEPIYAVFGGWPAWTVRPARALGIVGLLWWLIPSKTPLGRFSRRTSALFAFQVLYLSMIQVFPWYLPPAAVCLLPCLATGLFVAPRTLFVAFLAALVVVVLHDGNRLLPKPTLTAPILLALSAMGAIAYFEKRAVRRPFPFTSAVLFSALSGLLLSLFAMTTVELNVQQEVIEFKHRQKIGEWLRERVKPNESIYTECLGYFGYFSDGWMHDFPGLVSPRVVQLRRAGRLDQFALIDALQPDWMVLRPQEYNRAARLPYVQQHYQVEMEFSVSKVLTQDYSWLPGLGYLTFDSRFVVLHKIL